jgi:rhodanese-related sulfurtransferase
MHARGSYDSSGFGWMLSGLGHHLQRSEHPLCHWDEVGAAFVLDVREVSELAVEQLPGALNIPLGQLRERLDELPRDREIVVLCRSGQRAYYATRVLLQHGFAARVVSGGMLSSAIRPAVGASVATVGRA